MLNRETGVLLGFAVALGVGLTPATAADSASEVTGQIREAINRADQGMQEIERNATLLVEKANQLLIDGKYFEARDKYLEAIKAFEKFNSAVFKAKIEQCRQQISRCYAYKAEEAILQADRYARARDFEEAIKVCKEAIEYYPEGASKLQAKIAEYEKNQARLLTQSESSTEKLLPSKSSQDYQIQVLMEQGIQLESVSEYGKALRKFEEILLIDPFNAEALHNIRAIHRRVSKVGLKRYGDMHRRTMAEVEWKYAIPIVPEGNSSAAVNMIDNLPKVKVEQELTPFQKKLKSIILPRVAFEDVSVTAAVNNLREQSRRQDPERVGVNILVLPSNVGQRLAQEAANDAMGGMVDPNQQFPGMQPPGVQVPGQQRFPRQQPGAEGTGEVISPDDQPVSLSIENSSLLDIIEKLCDTAKLEYVIDDHAVIIAPKGVSLQNMVTKWLPVDESPVDDPNRPGALQEFFEKQGVSFPVGARIGYSATINTLVVTNTAANIRKIEEIIHTVLDRQEPMIQIMAKYIEISQNDLKELAFNYQLSVNNQAQNDSTDVYYTADGELRRSVVMKENSNELMRYYVDDEGSASTTARDPLSDGTFSLAWQNADGTRIVASMFALNYADSADVLGSPRVVTIPGQAARVEMVTQRYYPSDWNVIDIDMDSGSDGDSDSETITRWRAISADPQPNLENQQDTGITFEITPYLDDPERRLISAQVVLPIKTFSGWMEFDARTYDSDGEVDGEYYKMPIFDFRKIDTNISLYDGETIVLGGVASDQVETVDDKIPILGDLPLIGRFFQSKYTNSEKRNILVFLTCRLVKPDGSAFYPDEDRSRGLPEFSRNR